MLLGKIGINNLHLLSPVIPPRLKTITLLFIIIINIIVITMAIMSSIPVDKTQS